MFSSVQNRVREQVADGLGWVKVARGVYLKPDATHPTVPPWEVRRVVSAARIFAVRHLLSTGPPVTFTGEAAMVAMGLDPWWNNPDVLFRSQTTRRGTPTLPSLVLRGKRVAGVAAREVRSGSLTGEAQGLSYESVDVAPPWLIAADIARNFHPLQSVHDCGELLRYGSSFDRFDQVSSRARAEKLRGDWLQRLEKLNRSRGIRRSKAVFHLADPACESPAESIVAWCLRLILMEPESLRSQYEVNSGARFFLDFALPDAGLAIEVTGFGKFGSSSGEAHHVGQKLVRRQQLLADSGFTTINITYQQARNPHTLIRDLMRRLPMHGVAVKPPSGPCWDPSMSQVFSRSRRF